MRTFEEIKEEIRQANIRNDIRSLRALASEMQTLGTPHAKAHAHIALGIAEDLDGNYTAALEYYRHSLTMHEELGDRAGMARVTANIGIVLYSTGDYPSSLEHYYRALAMFEEIGNHAGVASVTGNIGGVYEATGDYPSALEHNRRALAMYEQIGDRRGVCRITVNIGSVYLAIGDYPSALEYDGRALAMYEELGDLIGVAVVTGNMGNVYSGTGDNPTALEYLRRALTIHEQLDDRASVVRVIGNIVAVLVKLERYDDAANLQERQSSMLMNNPGVRAYHHANSALLAEYRNDLDASHHHLLEALAISMKTGLRARSTYFHELLRELAQKRNDFAGYIEHNNEYQRITEEIRGKDATLRMAMMEAERKVEAELRARDKERALLYGALPKSIADRMIRGEDVSGDHFDNAAVMFLDIVGFTSNTSHLPPTDVVKMLDNIFSMIDGTCDTHQVIKIKTMGDSYMCFRGDSDTTLNAHSMASVALDVMKGAFTWPNGEPIQFRGGIHIGPATAGVIGTQRLQYDVWGDTVNVASRMESTSEPGKIHVSEALANALNEHKNSPPAPSLTLR
ncbi:MAG: tetratricopeptide repeat protein [Ignavibacteria bacterium]|nr:tetratricopeptide repeat protein [Ignavibacteria bacterium]